MIPPPIDGPGTGQVVGIDRGVAVSAALSTGERLSVPGLRETEAQRLLRLQRRLARAKPGSNSRARVKTALARIKARQTDRRKDWVEQTSTELARRFDVVRVEDLKIKNMVRSARGTLAAPGTHVQAKAGLNRSIHAAGWGLLVTRLEDKAPGRVERINPAYTSQICHACGHCAAENRESQAVFRCRACGHADHADVNAAKNIAAGRAVTCPSRPTDPDRPPVRGALQPQGGAVNREPQPDSLLRVERVGIPRRQAGEDVKRTTIRCMPMRARRSTLAVPASNPRFIEKARGLPVDEFFLDLEDAVAPSAKADARANAVAALRDGGWGDRVRVVRINDVTTGFAYRDVIEVVEGAGADLDCLMLPKVTSPHDVVWLDVLLTQIERATGLPVGRIGIEAQIEDARGLTRIDEIAAASPRLEALVFGPGDLMASINMKTLVVGEQPPGYTEGDAYHYILMRILIAARARDLQAIDGPYFNVRDVEAFTRAARRSAALGFDGKWVLHPAQVEACNEVFSPAQDDYDHAELILDAYDHATRVQGRGAAMLGDEMIDEASRKMALVIAAKGRAAGLKRTKEFTPPG
jgi:citrate lyase subunit beta/citryl-CoA lyase